MVQEKALCKSTDGGAGKIIKGNESHERRCPMAGWIPSERCHIRSSEFASAVVVKGKGKNHQDSMGAQA